MPFKGKISVASKKPITGKGKFVGLDPELVRAVEEQTEVLRAPKQVLATFGMTSISYYLVTEPAYVDLLSELDPTGSGKSETVVRRGTVTSERPQIVTPYYLLNLFRGFEHGREFAQHLVETMGAHSSGLMYSYKNELLETTIVSDPLSTVAGRLVDDLDKRGENLAAVVRGIDHLWDVSLMKFIVELTVKSLGQNVADLGQRGLLGEERGLPKATRALFDEMFVSVARNEMAASDLKAELDHWGVFDEYQDRFFALFRR